MAVQKLQVQKLLDVFSECTKDPTVFLTNQPGIHEKFRFLVKECYDRSKLLEDRSAAPTFTLPKLIVAKFDTEQIWQQVELQNTFVCTELDKEIRALASELQSTGRNDGQTEKKRIIRKDGSNEEKEKVSKSVRFALPSGSSDDDSDQDIDDEDSENEDLEAENSEDEDLKDENSEDLEDENSEDEDLEDEIDEDDDLENENSEIDQDEESNDDDKNDAAEKNGKKDFSSPLKKTLFDEASDDENEPKSSFEERQRRLKQRVEKLEDDLLAEKPWQLKGEVTAKKRPENSLLDQVLEFDFSSRPAPIITEEAAVKLEDVIKNRIINKVWDDVERKIKPVDTPREFKKKLVLDQEKSKLSLAQVYEQDYLKQREAVSVENKNQKEEEPKEHKHLRVIMNSLFAKLDALSNYHYTPLPAIPEPQIVANLPAVTLEEAIPDATSTATLLAPEEVQNKVKGDFVSKEERTATDKKRARRKKKIKQRLKQKQIKSKENELQKLNPNVKSNFAKEKVKKDLERLLKDKSVSHFKEDTNGKSSKSSQQFFARLQDTVSSEGNVKKRKRESIKLDPKRLKL